MNQDEFTKRLRSVALDPAVDGVIGIVRAPPGRRPAQDLVELSRWFTTLSADDIGHVREMMELVAHQAVFGVLAILDGSRQVEETQGPKGHFELRHVTADGESTVLAGPGTGPIHEQL